MTTPAAISDERLGLPSASEFDRIMNCAGYLGLKRDVERQGVRPDKESAAATQGTELHALNEAGDTTDATYSEEDIVRVIRDREIILVKQWCEDLDIPFDQITIEREVRMWFNDTVSCKLDVLVWFGDSGFYLDTKTGRNKVLPPSKNWQMRVGAACARSARHLDRVRTAIVNVWGALMPPCDYKLEDILQINRLITRRLIEVNEPGLPTTLGPWCAYCPAIHVCDSQREQMGVAIQHRTLNWDLVTPEQKRGLFTASKMAVDAGTAILAQIKADITNDPDCIPGLKKSPDTHPKKITDPLKAAMELHVVIGREDTTVLKDVLRQSSLSIEAFTTLYRDATGASKSDAEKFIESKVGKFIERTDRSGQVKVVDQPKEIA